jgi:hypothetical protein
MSEFFSGGLTTAKIIQLVGIFFIFFSFVSIYRFLKLKGNGIIVNAVVKDIVQLGNDIYHYFPVFEYRTLTGETIVKRSYIGGRKEDYQIGQFVEISYDQDHPETFLIWKGFEKYAKIIGSLIMGIAFFLWGYFGGK